MTTCQDDNGHFLLVCTSLRIGKWIHTVGDGVRVVCMSLACEFNIQDEPSNRQHKLCFLAVAFAPACHLQAELLHPLGPLAGLTPALLILAGVSAMLTPELLFPSLPLVLQPFDNVNRAATV